MYLTGVDPNRTHTDQTFRLGTLAADHLGRVYVYLEADAAIDAKDVVIIHADFGAQGITRALAAATAGQGKRVAVAMVDVDSGDFFWGCVAGQNVEANVATSAAAYTNLHTVNTTAGRLGTGTSSEHKLRGIVGEVQASDNAAPVTLNHPFVHEAV